MRIDVKRAKKISQRLRKYERMKGGRTLVMKEAGITSNAWYRALAGAQIEVATAEKLEPFLGIETTASN